ncbi:MAG: hypothetical protein C0503_04275 [Gemmatimonas sp.]|nr:hypothetical protein [Gemmatimonas sp.]
MSIRFRSSSRLTSAAALAALLLAACDRTPAAADAETELAGGVYTIYTDSTELFMEHPALIVGQGGTFAVHLTDVTDFAPLRSGRVTMRFTARAGGAPLVVTQETPRVPGIYGPNPVFTRAGTYDLVVEVESPQSRDRINVPGLVVYADEASAPVDDGGEDAGIPFLKEQQWKTDGFRTAAVVEGSITAVAWVSGEIAPAPGAAQVVAAPASGLLLLDADAPAVGQQVAAGARLARIQPTLGDAGASFADARARLREAEEEFERAERLVRAEAIPERRLHEARIERDAAREALAAAGGGALAADGTLDVRAPIDGRIAARQGISGARVEAGAVLATIVDPRRAWIIARVPLDIAAQVDRAAPGVAMPEGLDSLRLTARPLGMSPVVDSLTRSITATYAVDAASSSVRVGALARVGLPLRLRESGLLIPSSAVLEEDGVSVVFVQTSGERFERRVVRVLGTDGRRTLVATGVSVGERVVSGAPYQVKLASLSTAVPTHGHEH